MRRYPPEGKVESLGRLLLVISVADHYVSTFPAESGDDPLETGIFAWWNGENR